MGLGGVGIAENYPEVSKDTMLSKLDILKDSFTANLFVIVIITVISKASVLVN